MARPCAVGDRDQIFKVGADGHFDPKVLSNIGSGPSIQLHHRVANSTMYTMKTSLDQCIESIRRNSTDLIVNPTPLDDDAPYTIPVASSEITLDFLTALNSSQYESQLATPDLPEFGLLSNVQHFSYQIYALVLLFIASVVLFMILESKLMQMRLTLIMYPRRTKARKILTHSCKHILNGRVTRLRFICFLIFTLYFFLATPFLIMFKTNQLVFKIPYMITSYERAIESNVSIILPQRTIDETRYLIPSRRSVERNDLINQFRNLCMRRRRPFSTSDLAGSRFEVLKKDLTNGEVIFISGVVTIELLKSFLCALIVNENSGLSIHTYHDAHQRTDIQGYAFRRGYVSKKLVKYYRWIVEMQTFRIDSEAIGRSGERFLASDDSDSRSRYEMCTKPEPLEARTIKGISSAKLELFYFLLYFMLLIYASAAVVLFIERLMKRRKVKVTIRKEMPAILSSSPFRVDD